MKGYHCTPPLCSFLAESRITPGFEAVKAGASTHESQKLNFLEVRKFAWEEGQMLQAGGRVFAAHAVCAACDCFVADS